MPAWLALLAALATTPAAPCPGEPLAPLFDALEAGRSVHILQIGDSHTAGDMISHAWRRRLQARFGDGGRGVLAAGRPYPGYLTWRVTAAQTQGWAVNSIFGDSFAPGGPPLGLSGFTQTARAAGEMLGLAADTPDDAFDRLTICAVVQPGGGRVKLRLGESEEVWSLDAAGIGSRCRTIDSLVPVMSTSLATEDDGMVSVTSFATFRRTGGAVISNLGVSGAQLSHLGRTDDRIVAAELAEYRPDLIVLAFGTNEGFSPTLTADAYEAGLRDQVSRLRRLAGTDVPILLLGAPDAATRTPSGPATPCGDGSSVPARLSQVRERQREVARELGLAFWDWSAAMGGLCSARQWGDAGLMRDDLVHFTQDGGDRIGAMIDADLVRADRCRG